MVWASFASVRVTGRTRHAAGGGEAEAARLDDSQSAVVRLPDDVSAIVAGAPGSGKTSTLVELVADRILVRGWSPNDLVVIAPSRASASRLRDRLALRVAVPTEGPLARSINSLAFEVVSFARQKAGLPPPRLLTGGEQDSDIAQLLDGHLEDGTGPNWPDPLTPEVRRLRGFRTELRDTMMRATEYGLTPARLRELASRHDRAEWAAVADFQAEYLQVMGEVRPHQLDAAELVAAAVRAIEAGIVPERLARLRLIVVDDVQEATRATLSLVSALSRHGASVIALGDPDVASNVFRGGEADVVGRFGEKLGRSDIVPLHLTTSHRQGRNLLALTAAVTARIGTALTVGHRNPVVDTGSLAPAPGDVLTLIGPTPARLWSTITRRLREHHIHDGVAWSEMAVVVRSRAQVPAIVRALALADVPARTVAGGAPLREEAAVRALLAVVEAGIGRIDVTPDIAADMLVGVFGGLDRLALRRLRLALRTEEIAGGGDRPSGELLVEALAAPGRFATIDHPSSRAAARLAETLQLVRSAANDGASIEELLWLVWDRSQRAAEWRAQAMGAGILASEANRNLDGIVELFAAAKRFVEREPGSAASAFLAAVLDAEVPEDTLAPASRTDAVLVTTPAGALGLEFDTVIVAGLQDGVWPNLRPRGSLLFPAQLGRAALEGAGPVSGADTLDERKEVLFDELRMFALAVSRARTSVILAAVANDDEAVSVFFDLAPDGATALSPERETPLTLRGIVGKLRRQLADSRGTDLAAAANLAFLAEEGVAGADPDDWHGVLDSSDERPLFLDDEPVPVSPSRLGSFEESPLDWFIDSVSGTQSSTAMGLGTIVHWAMETAAEPAAEAVWAAIESRWTELAFEAPWLAEQHRRAARKLATAVAEYLADFERENKQLIAAERRFRLEIGRARLNGSIDRVERNSDGSIVIVDLKTGKPETSQAAIDAFPQLGAYQLAYASGVLDDVLEPVGDHHAGGAKLLFVREGKGGKAYREGVQAPLSDEQLEEFRDRIRRAAIGMALGVYPGSRVLDPYSFGNTMGRTVHRVRAVTSG